MVELAFLFWFLAVIAFFFIKAIQAAFRADARARLNRKFQETIKNWTGGDDGDRT